MIRRIEGTFRTAGQSQLGAGRLNAEDKVFKTAPPAGGGGLLSNWTTGATLLDDNVSLFPAQSDKLEVLGFFVSAFIGIQAATTLPPAAFGKLGNIIAGLTTTGSRTTGPPGSPFGPYTAPMLPLPQDLTLVGDLWNPANDPLPRWSDPAPAYTGMPIKLIQSLPQSIPIPRGDFNNLLIGIWMTPSLVNCISAANTIPAAALCIFDATWGITYDDGNK